MKKTIFLCFSLFFTVGLMAQTDDDGEIVYMYQQQQDSINLAICQEADSLYDKFCSLSGSAGDEANDEKYAAMQSSLYMYLSCVDHLEPSLQSSIKDKIRKMYDDFEDAAIYYSGKGDNAKAYEYLKCHMSVIPRLSMFENEVFPRSGNYVQYLSFACIEAYNAGEFEESADYAKKYIDLGEKDMQETCYRVLARDLDSLDRRTDEAEVLDEALMNYPNNEELLIQAVNLHRRLGNNAKAGELLQKVEMLLPNDDQLKFYRACLNCDEGKYADALPVLESLYDKSPNNITYMHQLALCYYGSGATSINESNHAEGDAERFKALNEHAVECFNKAIPLMEQLQQSKMLSEGDEKLILSALSESYKMVGRSDDSRKISQMAEERRMALSATAKEEIPNFNEWYKPRLDKVLQNWEQRGEFESAADYQKRVNTEARAQLAADTRRKLENDFIGAYSHLYNLDDLTIKPYDPDHQTFRIQTKQGDIYLSVPLDNDEAKNFKDSWNSVRIVSPQFKVNKSGQLLLAQAQFRTPSGSVYTYDANKPLEYGMIKIAKPQWNDDDLFAAVDADEDKPAKKTAGVNTPDEPINVGDSSVDVNVPVNKKNENTNTFALIISNENYKNVDNVPYAANDGKSFKRYCTQVLGIPEDNIVHVPDAGVVNMIEAVDNIKEIEDIYKGINLLVYYSGHGLPDPSTGEAYLLPTDASPRNLSTAYKLSTFYAELASGQPKSITVFLDACFSGSKKDGKVMDSEARGVRVKPIDETPKSNMVVFSACTGEQTAYPYNNEKHGLFTFYLLKKLQEDKGKTTYKQLAEYISTNVKQMSRKLQGSMQSPTVQSALPESEWGSKRLDRDR